MSFIHLVHVLTSAAMSFHPQDPDVPLLAGSTLETIGRISQTVSTSYFQLGGDLDFPQAGKFTRCGLAGLGQHLVCAPIVSEHRIEIHVQAMASSDTKAPVPYTPYTHFKPLEEHKEDGTPPYRETTHSTHEPQVCLKVLLFSLCSPYLASQSFRRSRHLPDFDGNDTNSSQNLSGPSGSSRNRNPCSLIHRECQRSYPSIQSPYQQSHSPNPPAPSILGPMPLANAPSQIDLVPIDDPMNDLVPGCPQADTILTAPSQILEDCLSSR